MLIEPLIETKTTLIEIKRAITANLLRFMKLINLIGLIFLIVPNSKVKT